MIKSCFCGAVVGETVRQHRLARDGENVDHCAVRGAQLLLARLG